MKLASFGLAGLCLVFICLSGYPRNDYTFRRVKEVSLAELTPGRVDAIISRQGLIAKLQAVAQEAIEDPSIIDPKVLARGVVLEMARELPQYSRIDIGEFLGIELNADQINGIYEVAKLFRKVHPEAVKDIKAVLEGEKAISLLTAETPDLSGEEQPVELPPNLPPLPAGDWRSPRGEFEVKINKGEVYFEKRSYFNDHTYEIVTLAVDKKGTRLGYERIDEKHPGSDWDYPKVTAEVSGNALVTFTYLKGEGLVFVVTDEFYKRIKGTGGDMDTIYNFNDGSMRIIPLSEAGDFFSP